MKKIKLTYLISGAVLLSVLGAKALLSFIQLLHSNDGFTINVTNNYTYNHICIIGDDHYYTNGDSINDSSGHSVLSGLSAPLIYSDNENIYVYSDKKLRKFDTDFVMVEEYDIGINAESFAVRDNIFFGIDEDYGANIIELDSMAAIDIPAEAHSLDRSYLEYYDIDMYRIIASDMDSCAITHNNGILTRYKGEYGEHIIEESNTELIASSSLNTYEPCIYKFKYETDEVSEADSAGGFYPKTISPVNSKIIVIGTVFPGDPNLWLDDMLTNRYHRSDCLVIINSEDMTVEKTYKTKRKERIVYADDEKAITYYKGKYITHRVDNWKKISSQKADELEKNGSYTFETCGDYVFVFDNSTGDIINRLSIA